MTAVTPGEHSRPLSFRVGRSTFRPGERTLVMGVLNVTPDSFSDGGRFLGREAAMEQALRMVEQGADIVDVGGESTRPGAPEVPVDVEMNRVVPVVEMLSKAGVPAISVDTRKAAVAQAALEVGAGMVNDVSALLHDESMATVCARHGAAVVLMHMRGNPATMQDGPITYDNVVEEVAAFLGGAAKYAISLGIEPSQVLVDPGFGFGKTVRHNLDLMLGMGALAALGFPVVWGPSRKSSLGAVTGVEDPRGRLPATLAACVMAVERGAHVVRVHDVAEVRQALLVVDACRAGG